ncbi:hypothetical protein N7495_008388 [Penicillium taxi]|uniref:uncharacterized protein n=1 Tax=Penicillium taxi TaxID=168475 RepID=UPI002544F8FC|nr:uncharacterized protein N7495_008388 [Penicillium taxi]KAJ5888347.1 hypothetical protein N7495_008388 [Penicillium taxi]
MSSHLYDISEDSDSSHDTDLSTDARLARTAEKELQRKNCRESTSGRVTSRNSLQNTSTVRSVVLTSSSFAERMEAAKLLKGNQLVVIGRGTCGTIFEIPGTETAYKKGSVKESLWNDVNLTNTACRAVMATKDILQEVFPEISIPRVPVVTGWVGENQISEWWQKNSARFPTKDAKSGYLFQIQRILPFPKSAREALIRLYFPKELQRFALEDPENKPYLVRPYLGQKRGEQEISNPAISLQNYPLYLLTRP